MQHGPHGPCAMRHRVAKQVRCVSLSLGCYRLLCHGRSDSTGWKLCVFFSTTTWFSGGYDHVVKVPSSLPFHEQGLARSRVPAEWTCFADRLACLLWTDVGHAFEAERGVRSESRCEPELATLAPLRVASMPASPDSSIALARCSTGTRWTLCCRCPVAGSSFPLVPLSSLPVPAQPRCPCLAPTGVNPDCAIGDCCHREQRAQGVGHSRRRQARAHLQRPPEKRHLPRYACHSDCAFCIALSTSSRRFCWGAAALDSSASRLLSGSLDHTVKIWDLASYKVLAALFRPFSCSCWQPTFTCLWLGGCRSRIA